MEMGVWESEIKSTLVGEWIVNDFICVVGTCKITEKGSRGVKLEYPPNLVTS